MVSCLCMRGDEREGRGLERESAVLDEDGVMGGGADELLDEGAGDGIEDDACAFASGDFPDAGDEVFFRGGDDVIGAEGEELVALL